MCLEAVMHWPMPLRESCRAKADVVARDEREAGIGRLNLGHTFGHARKAFAGHNSERLVHGEGVAIGMSLAHQFSAYEPM